MSDGMTAINWSEWPGEELNLIHASILRLSWEMDRSILHLYGRSYRNDPEYIRLEKEAAEKWARLEEIEAVIYGRHGGPPAEPGGHRGT